MKDNNPDIALFWSLLQKGLGLEEVWGLGFS